MPGEFVKKIETASLVHWRLPVYQKQGAVSKNGDFGELLNNWGFFSYA